MAIKHHVVIFILLLLSIGAYGQVTKIDSSAKVTGKVVEPMDEEAKPHSPKKATLFSVFLPGAGQIYNKKYWKAPVAWVTIGGAIYWGEVNRKEYLYWSDQYKLRIDPNQEDSHPNSSDSFLQYQRDEYRRLMETSYVVAGVFYILQIIDATVDAHLMTFDVSDDLSMKVTPGVLEWQNYANRPTYGVALTFGLKK